MGHNTCTSMGPVLFVVRRYTMKNVNLVKFKMADLRPHLTSICLITGKSCQIARPLPLNKMCGFREGYVLKKFNSIKFKMADMRQLSTLKCVISRKPYEVAIPLQ